MGTQSLGQGDLTTGPVFRTLVFFSSPLVLVNLLQAMSVTVNAFWIGRLIGDEALAATANASIVVYLISAVAFGFGAAGAIKVGRSFGAQDLQATRRAFGTTFSFGVLLMAVVGSLGYLLAAPILTLLGTPGGAYGLAVAYLKVTFIAIPALAAFVIISACLRGVGDSRTPLKFTAFIVVADFILNPFMIRGGWMFPPLGIAGSALATLIANLLGLAGLVLYIRKKDLSISLRGSQLLYLWPRREELWFIVSKGLPIGAQSVVMSTSGMILVALINNEGLLATAAYGAASQLWIYAQIPALAIGSGASAMAAQFIGAHKWERLESVTNAGIVATFLATGTITLLLILFDRQALGIFLGSESAAIKLGENVLLLSSCSFIFYGIDMVCVATMRAAGVVWIPFAINILALYPGRLGFYFIGYKWLGADAIWLSFSAGALTGMALTYIFYRCSAWRQWATSDVLPGNSSSLM